MSDWVHIEPPAPRLTPVQERIREMLRAGKTFREICRTLMIRSDHLRDEIYEIRKYEAIMGKGKLTNEQRAAIYDAWKGGITQAELAKQYGISYQAISQICKKMGEGKAAAVNQAFEDAVNEMIAEAKEQEPTNENTIVDTLDTIVDTLDTIVDTLDTIEDTKPEVPDAVMDAVRDKIDDLQKQVDERAAEIALLSEKICSLNAWLSEVQA